MNRHARVFGASGQIGRFLLPRLLDAGWRVDAVSRRAGVERDGVSWQRADLFQPRALSPDADVLFALGPLDGLVRWLEGGGSAAPRLVAFGSTSASSKRDSPDPHERRLAAALRQSEAALAQIATARGIRWTLLRPTLIYGAGLDHNLSRIASLARRFGALALPRDARGLRQPVHADDLAAAALATVDCAASYARSYDLPGGETLEYCEMVARVLGALQPAPRLCLLPPALFSAGLALARTFGAFGDAGAGITARLREALVFDAGDARRDFGYAPRAFAPDATTFPAQPLDTLLRRSTT